MLDVSIRLEIMNLLDALKRDRNLALLYITHDLATARHFSARIMVMYRGEIVEQGRVDEVILNPAHPYTRAARIGRATRGRPSGTSRRAAARAAAAEESRPGQLGRLGHPGSGARGRERPPRAAGSARATRMRCRSALPVRLTST